MPAFDKLDSAKFDDVEFPIENCHVRSTLRTHNHEYPPAPGSAVEKMGRTPYTIEMSGIFHANLPSFKKLWPEGIQKLRKNYESGATKPLVIPTIGTIPAYLTEWDQSMEYKVRSGERCSLKFAEDFRDQFVISKLVDVSSGNMASALQKFAVASSVTSADEALQKFAKRKNRPSLASIFDKVQDAVNSVLAIRDQGNLQMALIESKILAATRLLGEIDRTLDQLQHPENSAMLDAMQELWISLINLRDNLKETVLTPRTWRTPSQMTAGEISAALYNGDGSRGGDILALNILDDPFAVPAGSSIRYYPEAS